MPADFDVLVVGAGPAGARTARDLALDGFSVLLVEEHNRIGEPCHCSGLISLRTLEAAAAGPGLVLNRIKGATFHVQGSQVLQLTAKDAGVCVVDRIELDRRLVRQATDAGVDLRRGVKFLGFRLEGSTNGAGGRTVVTLEKAERRFEVSARLLVGADGARSRVARQLRGADAPRMVRAVGAHAHYQGNPFDHHVQVFLDERAAPGWFGWSIPLGDGRARLGTGTTNGIKPATSFRRLSEVFPESFARARLTERRAGCIPLWEPTQMVADRLILVGDAARQVKPASGGGILTALVSARIAAEKAGAALRSGDLSGSALRSYERCWDRRVGRELKRQYDMRRALGGFGEQKVQRLVRALARPRLRSALEASGDIDLPSALVWRLMVRHPALVFSIAAVPQFPLAWLALRRPSRLPGGHEDRPAGW